MKGDEVVFEQDHIHTYILIFIWLPLLSAKTGIGICIYIYIYTEVHPVLGLSEHEVGSAFSAAFACAARNPRSHCQYGKLITSGRQFGSFELLLVWFGAHTLILLLDIARVHETETETDSHQAIIKGPTSTVGLPTQLLTSLHW